MRHRKSTVKLGRRNGHREAMIANLVCSLIAHRRITTTLARAKAIRPIAEKMVTLAKEGTLHARRLTVARLRGNKDAAKTLFTEIAPACKNRVGGYLRILKLGQRMSDASPMAIIEWVDQPVEAPEVEVVPAAAQAEPQAD